MRKKEIVSCGCTQCTRGKRTKHGHYIVTEVNRRLRRRYKDALKRDPESVPFIVGTPYTD